MAALNAGVTSFKPQLLALPVAMRPLSSLLLILTCVSIACASMITLQPANATANFEVTEAVVPVATDSAPEQASTGDADVTTMRRILAELPEPEPELANLPEGMSKDDLAALLRKVWARRQQQLMDAMNSFKDDAHFMKELLQRLVKHAALDDGEIVVILEDLEFHVAKVDNAVDFAHVRLRCR